MFGHVSGCGGPARWTLKSATVGRCVQGGGGEGLVGEAPIMEMVQGLMVGVPEGPSPPGDGGFGQHLGQGSSGGLVMGSSPDRCPQGRPAGVQGQQGWG